MGSTPGGDRAPFAGYAGTDASFGGRGVYRLELDGDTGALTAPRLLVEAADAKYVSVRGGLLAAPFRRGARAGLLLADAASGAPRGEWLDEAVPSCFVRQDRGRVYTANYHDGCVRVYSREGLLARIETGPRSGCHQALVRGGLLLTPCLERDAILLFDAGRFSPAGSVAFPAGSGPRHGVFGGVFGERLFVAGERSCAVYVFEGKPPFAPLQTLPLLESGEAGSAAAIRLSGDGRFLYVSVRGANALFVIAADGGGARVVQRTGCGGDHPRDIALSPDGRFLLAANRGSGDIVCFRRSAQTGRIGRAVARQGVAGAVSLTFQY